MNDEVVTLTRKAQVIEVLKAGGKVRRGERAGLYALVDKDGREVDAWQTAIKSAMQQWTKGSGRVTARATTCGDGRTFADSSDGNEPFRTVYRRHPGEVE